MAADLDTKASKKKLRELAGLAYCRELGAELAKLEAEFARWRSGEIDPFELNDRIHRFHDGVSRDLFVFYGQRYPTNVVARAVALNVLREEDVPVGILEALEGSIGLYGKESFERDVEIED